MTTALAELLAGLHAGAVDHARLAAGVRDALLVVPTDGAESVLTGREHDREIVHAFTDTTALAEFATARRAGGQEWNYLSIRGHRLVEVLAAELGPDTVLAVNAAGRSPGLFEISALLDEGDFQHR
jgi:hypothetical protein